MNRRLLCGGVLLLLLSACSGGTGSDATSTTVVPASTTTLDDGTSSQTVAPTTTTTRPVVTPTSPVVTTTLSPAAGPAYYRYGADGLHRVGAGEEIRLVDQAVVWAADDLMGGVVYRLDWDLDPETTYRLRADGSIETLEIDPLFVAVVDGRPTAVEVVDTPDFDVKRDLRLTDLRTGNDRRIQGEFYGGDGWSHPTAYGGEIYVGVLGIAAGCGYSDSTIVFWDDAGEEFDHPHNPAVEPCGPCELSAAISPDGRLLAYTRRPDAPSDSHGRVECGPDGATKEEWWETTQDITGEVAVIDLATGATVFEAEVAPQTFVAGFDGRNLVVESRRWGSRDRPIAIVYDTLGERPPVEVEGLVALVRDPVGTPSIVLRHDGLGLVDFGDPAEDVMAFLTELLGPPDWEEIQVGADVDLSVRWDDPYLYVQFTYWGHFDAALRPPEPMPEGPVFHYYLTRSDVLATAAGAGAGVTVGSLRAAHPDVRFTTGCDEEEWEFVIDPSDGWLRLPMWGLLDGDPTEPATRIVHIGAGRDRTPC